MMKFLIIFISSLSFNLVYANEFNSIDKDLSNEIIRILTNQSDLKSDNSSKKSCLVKTISIDSLIKCHVYVESIYVTDDIDTYMAYVNQLLYLGVDVTELSVYQKIINTGFDEVVSQLYFDIAKFSYIFNRYPMALSYLKKIDDNLEEGHVYHALLIYGLIYFETGDVKKAEKYFKRISVNSEFYASAQFNLGLMGMRSLWWSDAEENLNNAIATFDFKNMNKEQSLFLDNLYLTIGYSQLSRKDFRSSKKSFEMISLRSPVKTRALMGIALSEIGLNKLGKAASLLKIIEKEGDVSVVLDALVTLPQVYHKAKNIKAAVSYYDLAIDKMRSLKEGRGVGNYINHSDWFFKAYNKRMSVVNNLIKINRSRQSALIINKISVSLKNKKNK